MTVNWIIGIAVGYVVGMLILYRLATRCFICPHCRAGYYISRADTEFTCWKCKKTSKVPTGKS